MKFADLPFVNNSDGNEIAWSPERSGVFEKDCRKGREYFAALREAMKAEDNPLLLSRVLAAQVRGGTWEGAEIGFAQAMAEELLYR